MKAFRVPRKLMLLVAVGLTVLGFRLAHVALHGGPAPLHDDWRISQFVLWPWVNGTLSLGQMFQPHNEHRIFSLRLIQLVEFVINSGQWDMYVGVLTGVLLVVAAVCLILLRCESLSLLTAVFAALLWSIPNHVWMNVLWNFAQVWYIYIFFSVAALFLLRPQSLGLSWWLAMLCGMLAFFSVASVAVFFAIFLYEVVRVVVRPSARVRSGIAALVIVGIVYFCTRLTIGVAAGGMLQRFLSFEFVFALIPNLMGRLRWPFVTSSFWVSLFVYAPFLAFLVLGALRKQVVTAQTRIGALLALWIVCHVLVMCLGRGATDAERYMEPPVFGVLANYLILAGIASLPAFARIAKPALWAWVVGIVLGLSVVWTVKEPFHWSEIAAQPQFQRGVVDTTRQFLQGDPNAFAKVNAKLLPFPMHVARESIESLRGLAPFQPLSFHFYTSTPYDEIGVGEVWSLFWKGRVGVLSLVAWGAIRFWYAFVLLAVTCLGISEMKKRGPRVAQ